MKKVAYIKRVFNITTTPWGLFDEKKTENPQVQIWDLSQRLSVIMPCHEENAILISLTFRLLARNSDEWMTVDDEHEKMKYYHSVKCSVSSELKRVYTKKMSNFLKLKKKKKIL